MTKQERIDLLLTAQEQIEEAINSIQEALQGTHHESHADAYIVGHLRNWAHNDNPYDYGIPKYIELLEEGEGLEDDEEEE